MNADSGALTNILLQFTNVFSSGRGNVFRYAWYLLYLLASLDLALAGICWLLKQTEVLPLFIKKILTLGLFIFLVQGFGPGYKGVNLANVIMQGFIQTGSVAGGNANVVNVMADPSAIINLAFPATDPIFETLKLKTIFTTGVSDLIIRGLCGLLIVFTYFILAIQIILTTIEFGIVSTLGLILLPFGVLKHTAFLAEKYFGAIISFGIKLMVLSFVMAVVFPILQSFKLPASPTLRQDFEMLFACGTIAFIAWHAPGVASAVLAGSPSLTAGTGAQGMLAGAMTAAAVGGPAAVAARGGAALAGAAYKGGFAALNHPFQSMRGSAQATGPIDAFKGGQQRGASLLEGKAMHAAKGSSAAPGQRESPLRDRLNQMNRAVPPEEKAGPGAGVNLKSSDEE